MKPKPFSLLNHLTVPSSGTASLLVGAGHSRRRVLTCWIRRAQPTGTGPRDECACDVTLRRLREPAVGVAWSSPPPVRAAYPALAAAQPPGMPVRSARPAFRQLS